MDRCCASEGCCSSKKSIFDTRTVTVDFLYLDLSQCGWCQGTEQNLNNAIAKVSDILKATGVELKLSKIHVSSEQQAEELGFTTSPTIRINDKDIQLHYKEVQCTACSDLCGDGVECRVWLYQGKEYTAPPEGMLIEAILREVYGHPTDNISCNPSKSNVPQNLIRFFHTDIRYYREVERKKALPGIFKALGDETRLKIVEMLSGKELCVCDILDAFDNSCFTPPYERRSRRPTVIVGSMASH